MSSEAKSGSNSLVKKIAGKFGVDPLKFWDTLKATAFKQRDGNPPSNEQMMALLIVADQYGLNPFTKEIYAFPDTQNGIVPVVGIDGWSRIINSHPQFDGMEFRYAETTIRLDGLDKPIFEWIECVMYRKDRERPTVVREYLDEIYRPPFKKNGPHGPYEVKGPWQSHTRRFSRHKVVIQTARLALGYTGIYDEDEADRIINGEVVKPQTAAPIEFTTDNEMAMLPEPQEQSELLQDLANADFGAVKEGEFVEVQTAGNVQQEQPGMSDLMDKPKPNEVVNTEFGKLSRKDANMISQMVRFTVENGSWENTRDSFNERYTGSTLEYALDELNKAFNKEFTPED